jgi:hypothetical protein
MAIMVRQPSRRTRGRFIGAINDTSLYTKTASELTRTSAYWQDVVANIDRDPLIPTVHSSYYRIENVQEDERSVSRVAYIVAPPDDTDW